MIGGAWNNGEFYVTSTKDKAASVSSWSPWSTYQNWGIFAFNSMKSLVGSTYNLTDLRRFHNWGKMYYGISNATVSESPINIQSRAMWENKGTIVFKKNGTHASDVNLSGLSIDNYGCMAFITTNFIHIAPIKGSGCLAAAKNGTVQLSMILPRPERDAKYSSSSATDLSDGRSGLYPLSSDIYSPFGSQVVYLADPSATLNIANLEKTVSYFTITLHGFGAGNAIRTSVIARSCTYDSTAGTLLIKLENSGVITINIGMGYKLNFIVHNVGTYSKVTTTQPPPNGAPDICMYDEEFPAPYNPGPPVTKRVSERANSLQTSIV